MHLVGVLFYPGLFVRHAYGKGQSPGEGFLDDPCVLGFAGEGELYTSGSNDAGQLGVKGRDLALEPVRVSALEMHNVHSVACGEGHMIAVIDNGQLAAWGNNDFGQLGKSPL